MYSSLKSASVYGASVVLDNSVSSSDAVAVSVSVSVAIVGEFCEG